MCPRDLGCFTADHQSEGMSTNGIALLPPG